MSTCSKHKNTNTNPDPNTGGAGGGVWGEGRLGVSAESAAPVTRSRIKRKTTSFKTGLHWPSLSKIAKAGSMIMVLLCLNGQQTCLHATPH
ncbi:hypothetical protein CHARACLAT_031964 [Characodon lateralis]|uniref:Uncharacterized protein n=1 Tax=Characodon lateralis TaxID=208331 RepID=A0ABU7E581_9TELE|nr:hypothetical protein [Characodon lateralis]